MELIMNKTVFKLLNFTALLLALGALTTQAQDFKPVTGEYILSKPGSSGPAEFGLIIRGQAAKEVFAALPFNAKPDVCTGGVSKTDPKGIFCIKDGTDYTCSMGIVLKTRKVTAGPLSC